MYEVRERGREDYDNVVVRDHRHNHDGCDNGRRDDCHNHGRGDHCARDFRELAQEHIDRALCDIEHGNFRGADRQLDEALRDLDLAQRFGHHHHFGHRHRYG